MSNKNFLVKNGITVGSFNLVNENGNITANSITFLDGSTQSSGQNITSNSINTSSINTSSISANSIVTNFITFSDGSRQSSIPKTLVGNENFSTATYYPLLTLTAAGSITSANTSSLGLSYVPSTGTLSANSIVTNFITFSDGSRQSSIPKTLVGNENFSTATYYPLLTLTAAGSITSANTSSLGLSYVPSTGTLTATILSSTSDANSKTNITNIQNPLDIIGSINGVRFNWISDGTPSAGLIAQEVEKYLPELISNGENGKSLNYNGIIGVLVEAIKAQQIQIDALTQKVK